MKIQKEKSKNSKKSDSFSKKDSSSSEKVKTDDFDKSKRSKKIKPKMTPIEDEPKKSSEKLKETAKSSHKEKSSKKDSSALQKENKKLKSKIKDYEKVLSVTYLPSKEEDNYFIDAEEEESNFTNKGKIGEGSTSITYKVIDERTKVPFCKKVLKFRKGQTTIKDAQNALKEFHVLHALNHPCICKAHYINPVQKIPNEHHSSNEEEEEEITTIAMFLEYLDYGLGEIIRSKIKNTLKVMIVVEIVHAMNFIHKHGMIHRDLKIENIMLNAVFQTKLVDFGLIRINECVLDEYSLVDDSMTKGVGTLSYMSPEMLNEEDYDNKTDVYSFGVVLYYVFFGSLPKQGLKDKTAGKQIRIQSKPSSSVSQFCIDLITKCLAPSPSDRPSFEMILDEIRKANFELASEVDPSIVSQRDKELELIENLK